MEFRILGPLEVLEDGRQVGLGGAKQRALLAVLLLHANEVVSTDTLSMRSGRTRFQRPAGRHSRCTSRSSARRSAENDSRHERPAICFAWRRQLDLERFRRLAGAGKFAEAWPYGEGRRCPTSRISASPRARSAASKSFARLYRGRVDVDLAAGRHATLVGELEMLVAKHPLRERLRAQLMLALYRAGRQAEALQAYQDARTPVEDLGIEPSPELRELQRAVLEQDPMLDLVPAPSMRANRAKDRVACSWGASTRSPS